MSAQAAHDIEFEVALAGDVEPADVAFHEAISKHQPKPTENSEVLGEMLKTSPSFANYIRKRVANNESSLTSEEGFPLPGPPHGVVRDWQQDFGPVSAPAGSVTTITIPMQCLFRAEKMIATDTGAPVGSGTRIMQVLVGQRVQRPASGINGTLTSFFAANALGNGVLWDTCQRALAIAVTVSFVQACTFDMSLFGSAVL